MVARCCNIRTKFSLPTKAATHDAHVQAKEAYLNFVTSRFSIGPSGKGSDLSTQGVGGFLKRIDTLCKPAVLARQHVHLSLQVAIHLQWHIAEC